MHLWLALPIHTLDVNGGILSIVLLYSDSRETTSPSEYMINAAGYSQLC